MRRYVLLGLLALLATAVVAACARAEPTFAPTPEPTAALIPAPTPDSRIAQILEELDKLGERLTQLEEQIGTIPTPPPTPQTMEMPTPTHEMMEDSNVQEVAIIENYAATRFFPRNTVVLKDIPVRLYLTRLHREHVNKFTIDPFYSSSEVILPGEIGVIEFLPDQVGAFKIRNVGHDFEADLVVVETLEEKKRSIVERGRQMYALIHSVDDFRIFPEQLVVVQGVPTTIHNISLIAEHKVSFKPFHDPQDVNIRPREVTPIELTPDTLGEFTIRHEIHGFTGTLMVEENR